jgi:hypothetical protein
VTLCVHFVERNDLYTPLIWRVILVSKCLIVPPQAWSGGGPGIHRRVAVIQGQHCLELWPYILYVRKCDAAGRLCREERQVTVSRVAHSSELLIALCDMEEVSVTTVTVFVHDSFRNRCTAVTLTSG